MIWVVIVIVVVIVLLLLWLVAMFNKLVRLRNRAENAWAQVDVQLRKRYDLIPNLVETVKGYAAHERGTLEAVVQARNAAVAAQGPAQQAAAENMLTGALRQMFALAEAYPDLKANQNFLQLQDQLSSIEGELQGARRYYNATVRDLNSSIQSFPAVLVAGPLGFKEEPFYQDDDPSIQSAPKVSFAEPAA